LFLINTAADRRDPPFKACSTCYHSNAWDRGLYFFSDHRWIFAFLRFYFVFSYVGKVFMMGRNFAVEVLKKP